MSASTTDFGGGDSRNVAGKVALADIKRDATEPLDLYVLFHADADAQLDSRLVRLGDAKRTIRGPKESCDVAGTTFRVCRTENGNVSLRTDEKQQRALTSRLIGRGVADGIETFSFEVISSNNSIIALESTIHGRVTQIQHKNTVELRLDPVKSARLGQWVYDLRIIADLRDAVARMPSAEETLDFRYSVTFDDGSTKTLGIYPSESEYGRMREASFASSRGTTRIVPYQTFRSRRVAYRIERFEPGAERLARWLPYFAWIVAPFRFACQIWLLGEVPYKAQDNGYRFFAYAASRRRRVYYVIRKDVADAKKVEGLGQVVYVGSKRHVWLSIASSRIVGSHHAEYLLASRAPRFVKSCRGTRIFLQHGVTATKNVVPNYGRLKSVERPTEKFVVVSEAEKRIVVSDYGYRPNQVPVLGFARFDRLFEPVEVQKRVLVMPTWRDDLKDAEAFLESSYFQAWHAFFAQDTKVDQLRRAGYQITLLMHPNMRPFVQHFDLQSADVLDLSQTDVQDMLRTSAILITDYSSVAWDFSFLDRTVLYFHFDTKRLINERRPHVDFTRDLPGPQCLSVDELWVSLLAAIKRDGALADEYRDNANRFIEYRDRNNCERIYNLVQHPGALGVVAERVRTARPVQALWTAFRASRFYFPAQMTLFRARSLWRPSRQVLFEADRGSHYSDSPRAIYEELLKRDLGLKFVWVDNSTRFYPDPRTLKVRRNSPAYFRHLARSSHWITNQNLRPGVRPLRGRTYVQTWHGTPLKRMQFDVPIMHGRKADYAKTARRQTNAWSVLLSPSAYATRCFRSAFDYHGHIHELGYPRNDLLSRSTESEKRRIRRQLGISPDDDRSIVLYAPTFRDDMREGVHWRHSLELDLAEWVDRFGDRAILALRFHPLVRRRAVPAQFASACIDVSSYSDVQEVLVASDVLITDYSSVFFDFAILRRPMVFYAYDIDRYSDVLRGFYLDYTSSVPGPVVATQEDLLNTVGSALERAEDFRLPAGFLETYAPLDDGRASERVVGEIFRG